MSEMANGGINSLWQLKKWNTDDTDTTDGHGVLICLLVYLGRFRSRGKNLIIPENS